MSQLVSILIPAYNAERYIKYTIESALSQTWDNKEIIIVNDGSLDNTLKIAKSYESRTVKVITQENRGGSAARNAAYIHAQGDYMQWLDADDLLDPQKISRQMAIASRDQARMTLFSSSFGWFYSGISRARFNPDDLWQDTLPVDWLLTTLYHHNWMCPAVWLVSRKLTDKAGPWNEQLSLDDDGEYFARVVAASESIKFVREAISYYRQSGFSQMSRSYTSKSHQSLLLSRVLSIQHLRSLEDSERTRRASLMALQRLYSYYYLADQAELLEKTRDAAHELGGELMLPTLSRKERIMRGLFGAKKGMHVMRMLRKLRLAATIKWDQILYTLNTLDNRVDNG